jgi:5'-nucleotidase
MAVAGTLGNQRPLRILISNDDGIDAPGLAALCDQLARIATVTIAAPSQNTSGTSHSMTFSDPIMVTETEKGGVKRYSIEATPATCVRLALESLLEAKPDLVVTGINRGSNLGMVTFYSATVGAAREAATKGIPAVAVSLQRGPIMDYAAAAAFVVELVSELNRRPLDPGLLLNVNIPSLPKDQIKGTLVVPQDLRPALQFYERRVNPRGQVYFWNTYQELDAGPEKTDVWAVRNGYIAVTPFRVDQTDPAKMNKLGRLRGAGRKY